MLVLLRPAPRRGPLGSLRELHDLSVSLHLLAASVTPAIRVAESDLATAPWAEPDDAVLQDVCEPTEDPLLAGLHVRHLCGPRSIGLGEMPLLPRLSLGQILGLDPSAVFIVARGGQPPLRIPVVPPQLPLLLSMQLLEWTGLRSI